MAYIYKPRGKAGEYGELALNHYIGCAHRCQFCYAPAAAFKDREQYKNASPRKIDPAKLDRELSQLRGCSVFMSFLTDPYQPLDVELQITRRMLEKFISFGVSPVILTKGGSRSTRDFDLLASDPGAKYGATLTFLDESLSVLWEPGASLPQDRIRALREAHSLGIHTWISLEPVISASQSLQIIRETKDFVDEYKIGKLNYLPEADRIDWKTFAQDAVELCRQLGKQFYIKKDLAVFLK